MCDVRGNAYFKRRCLTSPVGGAADLKQSGPHEYTGKQSVDSLHLVPAIVVLYG